MGAIVHFTNNDQSKIVGQNHQIPIRMMDAYQILEGDEIFFCSVCTKSIKKTMQADKNFNENHE